MRFRGFVYFLGSTPNQGKNDEARDLDDCLPTIAIEGIEKLFQDGLSLCARTDGARRDIHS